MEQKYIYRVPNGGQDSLSIRDQLSVLPKTDPKDRNRKRAIKREFANNCLRLSKVEAEYCYRVLGDQDDPNILYQTYLETWAKELLLMTQLKMFKLTYPNAKYFEHKYKPVSPSYQK